MASSLKGVRVAFVVANEGIEQGELLATWRAVMDAGARPELLAPRPGPGRHHAPPGAGRPVPGGPAHGTGPGGGLRRRRPSRAVWPTRIACGVIPRRCSSSWPWSRRASRWRPSATARARSSRATAGGADRDLDAQPADRSAQRRRPLARRRGQDLPGRRQRADHQPGWRRPARLLPRPHRGLRRVRLGQPRRPELA